MTNACGPTTLAVGCLNPCDDVHLCAEVERASRPNPDILGQTQTEYVYRFTVQNCSNSTMSNVALFLRLGVGVCNETPSMGPVTISGSIGNDEVDWNFCDPEVTPNLAWAGNDADIFANVNRLNSESFTVPPGSFQGWVRFTTSVADGVMALPSTVAMRAMVRDSVCKFPCRVEKCIETNGDCLNGTVTGSA